MRPRRSAAVVLVVLTLWTAGVVAVVGTTSGSGVAAEPPAEDRNVVVADDRPVPENGTVVMRIDVTANGDARWTVASGFALSNGTDETAFRALLADVRNGTPPGGTVGYSEATFRSFAARVERSLDRPADMRIEDAEWDGRVANHTGVLSLSFTWTDFARRDGSRVVLGDVFATGAGWFSGLGPDQRLVIDAPSGYNLDSSRIGVPFEDGTFYIDGPINLTARNVSIVYEPAVTSTPDTPTATPTPTPNGSDPGDDEGSGPGLALFGGLLLLVAAAALVAYVVSNDPLGGDGVPGSTGGSTDGDTAASTDGSAASAGESGPAAGAPPPADREDAAGPAAGGTGSAAEPSEAGQTAGGDAADGGGGADAEAEDEAEAVEPELLSDEERVERLLEANGGRMKQANIVSETGWSNAKVSQLLSSMDEDDRIDKLRIGRENLISLPDEDVGDFE